MSESERNQRPVVADEVSDLHPHEPGIIPPRALDPEGRCLVCALLVECDREIARLRDALVYLADPESWQGNPHDHASVLLGHFTPYELARETLGLEHSE